MIFQKIELKNIFKHVDSEIDFIPGMNLIVGPNDSGKSSIVEAISFALFLDTTKANKLEEIESDFGKPSKILLTFNNGFSIIRGVTAKEYDKIIENDTATNSGRREVSRRIEEVLGMQKYFFMNIAYAPQDELFSIINMTPGEREKLVNKILSLDYIDIIASVAGKNINTLNNLIAENKFILKKLDLSSEKRKQELLEELKSIEAVYREKQKERDRLIELHQLYEMHEILERKKKLIEAYLKLKGILKDINFKEKNIAELQSVLSELKEQESSIKLKIREINNKIKNISDVIKEGICTKCLRPVDKKDIDTFEAELQEAELMLQYLNERLSEIKKASSEAISSIKKIENSIQYKPEKVKVKLIEIRKNTLKLPSIRKIKNFINNRPKPEKDSALDIEQLDAYILEVKDTISRLKWEYNELLSKQIKKEREEIASRLKILDQKKKKLIKLKKIIQEGKLASTIRASIIHNLSAEKIYSIFNVGSMEITPELDIYINNKPIYLASGAQKVACALSLRLAMLRLYNTRFMILDEPTIYLDNERIDYLKNMLEVILKEGILDQIILISHDERFKTIADNIIEVSVKPNGESYISQGGAR